MRLDCYPRRLKSMQQFRPNRISPPDMSNNAFFSDLLASISERGRTLLRRAGSSQARQDASGLMELCEALLSGRGEASGTAMAREVLDRYHDLDEAGRLAFFETLTRHYGPDREKLAQAIETWRAQPNH